MASYHPQMSKPVTNQVKYESDRQECLQQAKSRQFKAIDENQGKTLAIGTFGLVGYAMVSAGQEDDYSKAPTTMVDECMTLKGYPVVKKN